MRHFCFLLESYYDYMSGTIACTSDGAGVCMVSTMSMEILTSMYCGGFLYCSGRCIYDTSFQTMYY